MNKKMFAICCAAAMMLTVNMASFADAPQAEISNAPVVEENQVNPDDYLVLVGYDDEGIPMYRLDGISIEEYENILSSIPETFDVAHRHNFIDTPVWVSVGMVDCNRMANKYDELFYRQQKCTKCNNTRLDQTRTMRDHGSHERLL